MPRLQDNNDDSPELQTRRPATRSRRRLLRALGTSSIALTVSSRWHRPIVESVVLPAHAQTSPGVCPTRLTGTGFWYETRPDTALSDLGVVRLQVTLTNAESSDMSFSATASDTFQLWTIPTVIDPPVTVNAAPSGTVPVGDSFSYDLEVDVSGLPGTETGLALRPVDNMSFGTLDPGQAPLQSATITCG